MIEKLKDVPDTIAAFRAVGEITKEDFTNLVIPEVEALVQRTDKLNYLLLLDTELKEFSAGAWLQDALLGIKNITKWNRAAIVSDSEGVIQFTNAFSVVMPGEFKGFRKNELQLAIDWVAEKIDTIK
ncbi:STAS/SEC14 domain-containing protein [Flavobacterium kingsejongi]|uniref:STAS/SEC14 domain-containing protein n=1 Tax=Flavobacterium kingsejongi TaxID=1678728 RepID=A0A2S1LQG2_9FLAO|nr:STAS/SEC14 domain-containing protein [Flavobacterium kingsejongi]AWG25959.1 STAS/SEC14 domain-containing protein [Flavobacterium kingsejongi]